MFELIDRTHVEVVAPERRERFDGVPSGLILDDVDLSRMSSWLLSQLAVNFDRLEAGFRVSRVAVVYLEGHGDAVDRDGSGGL